MREFIDAYNTGHGHSSLGGMTPAEKWASSAAPLDVVEPERLRWMLLADQTRKVDKDGIHFENGIFVAPDLNRVGRGTEVEVRYMPHDLRWIEVFTQDGWLCTAFPQERLSDEQIDAIVADPPIGRHPKSLTDPAAASRPLECPIDHLGRHARGGGEGRGTALQRAPKPGLIQPRILHQHGTAALCVLPCRRHGDLFRSCLHSSSYKPSISDAINFEGSDAACCALDHMEERPAGRRS